ncbi:MAG: hypothetical protein OHK006_12780 [Thermodesulfovibrionales bacterium]
MTQIISVQRGRRLRELREALAATQAHLGERIGVLGYQVRDMESGKVELSTTIAKLLYHEFGANPEWLLHGKGAMFDDRGAPEIDIVTEKVLLLLKDMDEGKKRDVLKYAEEKKLLMELQGQKKKHGGER